MYFLYALCGIWQVSIKKGLSGQTIFPGQKANVGTCSSVTSYNLEKVERQDRLERVTDFISFEVCPDFFCLLYLTPGVLPDFVFGHSLGYVCVCLYTWIPTPILLPPGFSRFLLLVSSSSVLESLSDCVISPPISLKLLSLCKGPSQSSCHPQVPIKPHLLLLCLSLTQFQPFWPPCHSSITPA